MSLTTSFDERQLMVVKHNSLIEAAFRLSEAKQRLILLAILKARAVTDSEEVLKRKVLMVYASDYMAVFDVKRNAAYQALKAACDGMMEDRFQYNYINERGKPAIGHGSFVQHINYEESVGMIKLKFSEDIIPFLVALDRNFTQYDIRLVSQLEGIYAIRLYETLAKYKNFGKFFISTEELRRRMGLQDFEYPRMFDFKKRVLDFALNQVNEFTDLAAQYTDKKSGRAIEGFWFTVKFQGTGLAKGRSEESLRALEIATAPVDVDEEEVAIIEAQIDDYVAFLNATGRQITARHKENITKKAMMEKWGVAAAKEQEERKRQNKQKRQQTQMVLDLLEEEDEKIRASEQSKNQMFVLNFEVMSEDIQRQIFDEVDRLVPGSVLANYRAARQAGTAHRDLMFRLHFRQAMTKLGYA
ncbi:RepB family plasmid replication initiator protein [Moraxella sp. ZJ142]